MSLPRIIIPSRNADNCEECGQYPRNIDNGVKHPYCSKTCARKAASARLPLSAQPQRHNLYHVKDCCEECGLHPQTVQQGYKHPYCSKFCAQNSRLRLPPDVKMLGRPDICPGCGRNPRAVVGGRRYTYCSKTCARKSSTSNPTICALLGCAAPASPAIGGFCSVAHANEWSRPRHTSLQNLHRDVIADPRPIQSSVSSIQRPRILFYHKHDPHYGFTNFSYHPVLYEGKEYPTSEHLFQSFKFQKHRPDIAEHIRTYSDKPSVAFSEARQHQNEIRSDWNQVKIQKMDTTLWHKFTQHLDLRTELLATGDAELVEDSDKDAFWGIGPDGRGCNELGKALERLRTAFRMA